MRTYLIYTPEDRYLDLDKLLKADFELISGLHGSITRGQRKLLCRVDGGDNGEMYVRRHGNNYGGQPSLP